MRVDVQSLGEVISNTNQTIHGRDQRGLVGYVRNGEVLILSSEVVSIPLRGFETSSTHADYDRGDWKAACEGR